MKFDNISTIKRVDLQTIQTAQTVRVNVRDEISKILTCSVDSIATSCECLQGEGVVNGRTNVKVLYLDQSGDVCSTNCNADFTNTVQGEVTPNGQMQAFVHVLESKASYFGNVITIEILLEVSSCVYANQDVVAFVDGDVFVKRVNKEVASKVGCFAVCGEIDQQLQTSKSIQRVLLADSVVDVSNFVVEQGVASVQGKAYVNLTYFSDKLCFETFEFDFSQEFVASGAIDSLNNSVWADVKNTKVKLEVVENEPNDLFAVEIVVCFNVLQSQTQTLSVIQDAYAKQCDLQLETQTACTTLPCGNARVSKKMITTMPQQIEGQIVCVANKHVNVVASECRDGGVKVEGVLAFDLLSMSQGEYITLPVQLPFAENLDVDFVAADCIVGIDASVNKLSVSNGNGARVDAELQFNVLAQKSISFAVISNVEEKPLQSLENYGIEISIANKGDTLWDLAKNLKMAQDEVVAINPEITSPLEESTKIVAYNKL